MEEVIKVDRLTKRYGNFTAVKDLTFSVKRGNIFRLLGANGAGKSTSIKCVLGTKKPDSGTVSVLDLHPEVHSKQLFERVGVQFQDANYQDKITASELCEVTASLYRDAADYRELLREFKIADKCESFVKDLSGGERQKLFIILALIPKPEVVFSDELTTGLDTRARRDVWKILSDQKAKGLTIHSTSHFMDEVEALCDSICILKHGQTVFYGTVAEAISKSPYKSFEDAYLWYTEEGIDNENILHNA